MTFPHPLALQLYTVRELCAKDLEGTLRSVAKIGYRAVETAGTYGRSPAEMRAALDRCGLRAICAHIKLAQILHDPAAVAQECAALGVRNIATSGPAHDQRNANGYRAWAADLEKAGTTMKARGIQICHHNHAWEFERHEGRSGLEWIAEETSPENVAFELDVYWAAKGGDDPVAWMRRLGARCHLLHLKDMSPAGDFAPVGAGTLDFARILDAAKGLAVEGCVVEQDACEGSPLDAIAVSLTNLKRLDSAFAAQS